MLPSQGELAELSHRDESLGDSSLVEFQFLDTFFVVLNLVSEPKPKAPPKPLGDLGDVGDGAG